MLRYIKAAFLQCTLLYLLIQKKILYSTLCKSESWFSLFVRHVITFLTLSNDLNQKIIYKKNFNLMCDKRRDGKCDGSLLSLTLNLNPNDELFTWLVGISLFFLLLYQHSTVSISSRDHSGFYSPEASPSLHCQYI